MGWLGQLLGNADEVNTASVERDVQDLMGEGERVSRAFQTLRDLLLFTDRRLLMIDQQGVTGSHREVVSVPYRSITHFTVVTSGHLDVDAEFRIWIQGQANPIYRKFTRADSIKAVLNALGTFIR